MRTGKPGSAGPVASLGVLAAVFSAMAAVSWLRWPDFLVDYGRELYVPWRIGAGDLLYRDIPHLSGPLAQHFNALLFALFGTGLRTLALFNLLLVAALTLLVYAIFARACGRLTATTCGTLFLGAFAFAHNTESGNWNFVCPYSHDLTYGVFLFFLLVPALQRLLAGGARRWALAVGLLLGLISLTKAEVLLPALAATAAGLCLPALRSRALRDVARGRLPFVIAGCSLPPLGFLLYFARHVPLAEAAGMAGAALAAPLRVRIADSFFYRQVLGVDAPGANLLAMLGVAAAYAAGIGAILALSVLAARRLDAARRPLVLAAAVAALGVLALVFRERTAWWFQVARPFPLLVPACAALWLRRAREDAAGEAPHETATLFVLSLFAFLLLAKTFLAVRLFDYGFALAMPAALVLSAAALREVPAAARRLGGCPLTAKTLAAAPILLFTLLLADQSRTVYRHMTWPVGTGPDRFLTFSPETREYGPIFDQALEAIVETVPEDAGLVAFPEGAMVNYLTRRRNPAKWFDFTPVLVSMDEARMHADLEAARPEYVVLVERPTEEFGAANFGADYGLELRDWIVRNYAPVRHFGARLFSFRGFGLTIARRSDLGEAPSAAGGAGP